MSIRNQKYNNGDFSDLQSESVETSLKNYFNIGDDFFGGEGIIHMTPISNYNEKELQFSIGSVKFENSNFD